MKHVLKNDYLTITVDSAGAELTSVQNAQGTEYLWNADPAYWKRHAPVLFPFVGSLKNKEYHYHGVSYPMGQHGFARDMEFTLLSTTQSEIWYFLKADDSTRSHYPFDFELQIGYRLEETKLTVLWQVTNHGQEPMPFSIGAHPAFYCPPTPDKKRTDYEFRFDNTSPLTYHAIAEGGLADTHTEHPLPETANHTLTISEHLFDGDALIVEGHQAHRIELAKKGEEPYITMLFDAPLFGLWAPPGAETPFVCIEPWYGRCDATDFNGTLEEREYGQTAAPGETVTFSYSITFA